jgi:hypothetical protein
MEKAEACAEAAEFNAITADQRVAHDVEDLVHDCLGAADREL